MTFLFTDVGESLPGVAPGGGPGPDFRLRHLYGALHRVIQAGYLYTLLATFAVNMIIIGIGTTVFSTSPRNVDFSLGSIELGPIILQGTRLLAAGAPSSITAGPLPVPLFHPAGQSHPGRVR